MTEKNEIKWIMNDFIVVLILWNDIVITQWSLNFNVF